MRTWRVVFRGPVSEEVLAGLPSERLLYVSRHTVGGRLQSSTFWVHAPDADSATELVRVAISSPGAVLPPEPVPHSVVFEVLPEEVGAVEHVLSGLRRETGRIGALILPAGENQVGEELHLDADADSVEGAASLPSRTTASYGAKLGCRRATRPAIGFIRHGRRNRRDTACCCGVLRELVDRGAPGPAVVVAQSAVEVLVDRTIGQRLQARDVAGLRAHIMGMIRTFTLNDDRTRAPIGVGSEIGRRPVVQSLSGSSVAPTLRQMNG